MSCLAQHSMRCVAHIQYDGNEIDLLRLLFAICVSGAVASNAAAAAAIAYCRQPRVVYGFSLTALRSAFEQYKRNVYFLLISNKKKLL